MAKIHINSHTTNIFCTNLQSCGGFVAEGGVCLGISSTLAMLYDVSSGVSESDMLLKCVPRITQSPLSIASLRRFFLSAAVHIATEFFFVSHTQNTGIDCPLFTNYSYLCQCIL